MICFHRNYDLGDKHDMDKDDLIETVKCKDVISLPLYLLDHSGLWMRVFRFAEDPGGWDTSMVGYIYCSLEEVRENWKIRKVTKRYRQAAIELLEDEVKEYSQYLEGDIWGFVINDPHGAQLDSCWGFYGFDCCVTEARANADELAKRYFAKEAILAYSRHAATMVTTA